MLYDPYAEHMQIDPFPTYRYFLEEEPCTYSPEMDFYALFRFEDVWQATLDWETYSSSFGPSLEARKPAGDMGSIIGMDRPKEIFLGNRNLAHVLVPVVAHVPTSGKELGQPGLRSDRGIGRGGWRVRT